MKMIKNAIGRMVPDEIDGRKIRPFMGAYADHGSGAKIGPPIRSTVDYENKLRASLDEAIDACEIKNGMTVSFHHHLRDGDFLVNMVAEKLAARGLRDLVFAPSALFPVHEPLVGHIERGVISHIEGSMNGPIGRACSVGRMKKVCVLRSHGGRCARDPGRRPPYRRRVHRGAGGGRLRQRERAVGALGLRAARLRGRRRALCGPGRRRDGQPRAVPRATRG